LRIDEFDYELPEELIAQHPVTPRDASRLLVLHRGTGAIEHRAFRELPEYLRAGDLLVLNDTRVIPRGCSGARPVTGGSAELLLLKTTGSDILGDAGAARAAGCSRGRSSFSARTSCAQRC